MPKSLLEYSDWLAERHLKWPAPPKVEPVSASPSTKPMQNIRAVTWSIYGTILRITDGELLFNHPQAIRMEVAIEKTIHEFNMWNSMTRKPGKPADSLLPKYLNTLEEEVLTSDNQKGELPEIDAARVWRKLLGLLDKKEYRYDVSLYGDINQLAEKVAYFFHCSLQGTEAAAGALVTLNAVAEGGIRQCALADGQCFTLVQLTRALREQGTVNDVRNLLPDSLNTLSYEWGMRKPSISLYAQMILRFKEFGIEPNQIMHVGTRIHDDLAVAKSCGMRTVLFAGDKVSLKATAQDLKNPETRPDRLITALPQLRDILSL
jgi:FMN phosphatase YigB (HAD superfamily)